MFGERPASSTAPDADGDGPRPMTWILGLLALALVVVGAAIWCALGHAVERTDGRSDRRRTSRVQPSGRRRRAATRRGTRHPGRQERARRDTASEGRYTAGARATRTPGQPHAGAPRSDAAGDGRPQGQHAAGHEPAAEGARRPAAGSASGAFEPGRRRGVRQRHAPRRHPAGPARSAARRLRPAGQPRRVHRGGAARDPRRRPAVADRRGLVAARAAAGAAAAARRGAGTGCRDRQSAGRLPATRGAGHGRRPRRRRHAAHDSGGGRRPLGPVRIGRLSAHHHDDPRRARSPGARRRVAHDHRKARGR